MATKTREINGVTIESGIPMPQRGQGRTGRCQAVLEAMKAGDSIALEKKKDGSWRAAAHKLEIKIAVRNQPDGSVRLWRLE